MTLLTAEAEKAAKQLGARVSEDVPLADFLAYGTVATSDPDVSIGRAPGELLPFEPLGESHAWVNGLGWVRWDGKRYAPITKEAFGESVRQAVRAFYLEQAALVTDSKDLNGLKPLLSAAKVRNVTELLRGVLQAESDTFDTEADFLNVQNGVVDLRTGELLPHDRKYRFTKITRGRYGVNTSHSDWMKTLQALPQEVREYMQVRYGQAATGYMTSDDKLPIQQGGGRNAKTTQVNGVANALGDFAAFVPEAVLTSGTNAHPTELMTLRGVRLAIVEELPEGRQLPVKRLKDLIGTQMITARYMRQDYVSFRATHSLFVNTNYVPKVNETDHGTWERLLLVKFPYTYVMPPEVPLDPSVEKVADPGLRGRLERGEDDVWDAVLFWVVQGAVKWYENGKTMPPVPLTVLNDTITWRSEADLILAYLGARTEIDPNASVSATELYNDFKAWLVLNEHPAWAPKTFTDRFNSHKVVERGKITESVTRTHHSISRPSWGVSTTTALPAQVKVYNGLKFKHAS